MRQAPIVLAAVALLSAIVATNVEAAVIKVTASGVVNHGVDGAGVFGQAGSDLVGEAYSAVLNIDTSKAYVTGGLESFLGAGPRYYSSKLHSLGGTPPINASFTIRSGSVLVDGSKLATNLYSADLHDNFNDLYQEVASDNADLNLFDGFNLTYPVAPGGQGGDFHDPNLNPINLAFSSFGANYSLGNFSYAGTRGDTDLSLDLFDLTYDVISAGGGPTSFTSGAPEPDIWALLFAGVGLTGAALRLRRRHQDALAVA